MEKQTISAVSSATWKWGVSLVDQSTDQWKHVGFFKTEKAAKTFAIATGRTEFLVSRRFDRAECIRSRNVDPVAPTPTVFAYA